jgi:hypothetical protein
MGIVLEDTAQGVRWHKEKAYVLPPKFH